MTHRVLWGALASAEGLTLVLGRTGGQPCAIEGHALMLDPVTHARLLTPMPGATAEGLVMTDLSTAEIARLHYVETALGANVALRIDTGYGPALCHAAAAFDPATSDVADQSLAMVAEVLTWIDDLPAVALARRRGPLAVQVASRQRAGQSAPTTLRHAAIPSDVAVQTLHHPYAHFFAVEERHLTWRRFDGTASPNVVRAVFVSGDAVTVLPYDPVRDRVLVVEQFRAGPQARGDGQPWQIEAVAGRVDPGESPETAARREAVEEAGLTLTDLHAVARYYPSPGAVSEYIYSYVALTDLPDGSAGVFGVADEAEDIRGHLISFDRLMELVASGEVENSPLILTALWLQRERPRLRGLA